MLNTIAISSGHGKYVRGAEGFIDEVDEARKVVGQVSKELQSLGVVCHTFNDDVSQTQSENLERICNWHNQQKRDYDVSIHFNANEPTTNPMGTEVLYVTQEDLALVISEAVAQAGDFKDRGPKYRGDLYFLNNTHEPAILIEVCFVDSEADVELYHKNFREICIAIASILAGDQEEEVAEDEDEEDEE